MLAEELAMFELVLTVCSIVAGAACREEYPIQLNPNADMRACLIASQIEGAKWVHSHPNHYVAKYTCQPAQTFQRI